MLAYAPGDSWSVQFRTADSRGQVTDADSLPGIVIYRDGVADTGNWGISGVSTRQAAGRYRVTGTVPAGATAGQLVEIDAVATVNKITTASFVERFRLVAAGNATSVWQGDTPGTTTLLTRLTSTRAALLDNLDVAVSGVMVEAVNAANRATTLLGRLTATRAALLDNLDAAVSAAVAAAGADTPGTITLLTRLTSTRAALLDHLDAAVSAAIAAAGADTPGTITLLTRLTSTRAALLDHLDAAVSAAIAAADSAALGSDGLDAVLVATGLNVRQALSLLLAVLAGKSSGLDTGSPAFLDAGDGVTARVSGTLDSGHNRTAVTLNPPA